MGVVSEALHHIADLSVVECVGHHLLSEELRLILAGELTEDQEESNFKEGTLFSENFDGISSILKDSLLSINERDF